MGTRNRVEDREVVVTSLRKVSFRGLGEGRETVEISWVEVEEDTHQRPKKWKN